MGRDSASGCIRQSLAALISFFLGIMSRFGCMAAFGTAILAGRANRGLETMRRDGSKRSRTPLSATPKISGARPSKVGMYTLFGSVRLPAGLMNW
jgi:hypothetical protein